MIENKSLTEEEYGLFRNFIFKTCGLWFKESKRDLLASKLSERLRHSGYKTFKEYYKSLQKVDSDRGELECLINLLTTNETYLFRNMPHFTALKETVLPEITARKTAAGERKLDIWSAGCSTGEEPYSIAMMLLDTVEFPKAWNMSIYATDISTEVLARAAEGVYGEKSVSKSDPDYLNRYFTCADGCYRIDDRVKRLVYFEYSNLIDAYIFQKYDIIFCRNVLIYFNNESKRQILAKFHEALHDDGYLFLGHSEMIHSLTKDFEPLYVNDTVVYKKVKRDQ